ncbi:MAG: class I tRNA ligase family protein, partial [Patescibacteria group bacterium]|nr:class I tRNA ligase family protein [Patescibacteria group bacterium]
ARFIEFKMDQDKKLKLEIKDFLEFTGKHHDNDITMLADTMAVVKEVTGYLEKYQFNLAAERLYEFSWHEFADKYIEDIKNRTNQSSFTVLVSVYVTILKLLHPFMPFVTEEIYQVLFKPNKPLIVASWPHS